MSEGAESSFRGYPSTWQGVFRRCRPFPSPHSHTLHCPAYKLIWKPVHPERGSEYLTLHKVWQIMTPEYELYTYFRSSCSARVRIAAHWKGIELKYKYIHLLKNEQQGSEYVDKLNPGKSVPTLVIRENGEEALVRQSVAILEYFEERHPELASLLPPASDPIGRAKVRDLVNIVACDIQPVTNLRILNRVKPLGVNAKEWQQEFMNVGLEAYEKVCRSSAGKYSVGDEVTMADVVLAPAVDGALRFEVDMSEFPTIQRVYDQVKQLDAFVKGSWKTQPDTPEDLR